MLGRCIIVMTTPVCACMQTKSAYIETCLVFQYVNIHVNPDQLMTFAGTNEPCANATVCSIGKIGKEENNVMTGKLMDKINKDLKISKDRYTYQE